jgi:hypothetical protein
VSASAPSAAVPKVDLEGLLCALVLVPTSYSRNRFFGVFEDPAARRVRRRAARLRGVVRHLVGHGRSRAEILGQQVLDDGRVLLRYRVEDFAFLRTIALSPLEASVLGVALHRAGIADLGAGDRSSVEAALRRLGAGLELGELP